MAGNAPDSDRGLGERGRERQAEGGTEWGNIVWKWQSGEGELASSRLFSENATGLERESWVCLYFNVS